MRINYLLIVMMVITYSCKSQKTTSKTESNEALSSAEQPAFIVNKFGDKIPTIHKTEEEWRSVLSDKEYYVLREKGTERAFTSPLNDNKQSGLYVCAACNTTLFTSSTKFDSGTGWPSFYKPDDPAFIKEDTDYHLGYPRTEVICARCGGHLGHVFEDGPAPTGLRYCINGVSLAFIKSEN